ncbi:MAG: NUDIX hydrolase [Rhodobacteraceae bacterium]|jgi:8-oxo-dGTP diphosphatase|nr:NUDIX hydrolase [Paracoccaceae bacterium]
MIRRYGESLRPGQRYRRRPGVYAVLLQGDSILATHQAEPRPEFQLPGGGIDAGEQPIAALHREVFEETGWKIAIRRRIGAFRRFTYMPEYDLWAEKLCTVYLARPILPLGPPREPGHTAVWLPVGEALELLGNAGDRAMLAQVVGGPR